MPNFDPSSLLELLRQSGWKTGAGCIAAILFLLAGAKGFMPALEAWETQITFLVAILCGCLSLASLLETVSSWLTPIIRRWSEARKEHRRKAEHVKEFAQAVPMFDEKEREIFAYLLHHNRRTFTGAIDGGYAMPLISQRFIVSNVRPGQAVTSDEAPFIVPPHIWEALQDQKDSFPYKPERRGEVRPHPWRVHWMVR